MVSRIDFLDSKGSQMSNDTGFVYDSKTQTFTELFWVHGVWTLKDGTVYRMVPLADPTNLKEDK